MLEWIFIRILQCSLPELATGRISEIKKKRGDQQSARTPVLEIDRQKHKQK
jgi:hypothetical protein